MNVIVVIMRCCSCDILLIRITRFSFLLPPISPSLKRAITKLDDLTKCDLLKRTELYRINNLELAWFETVLMAWSANGIITALWKLKMLRAKIDCNFYDILLLKLFVKFWYMIRRRRIKTIRIISGRISRKVLVTCEDLLSLRLHWKTLKASNNNNDNNKMTI